MIPLGGVTEYLCAANTTINFANPSLPSSLVKRFVFVHSKGGSYVKGTACFGDFGSLINESLSRVIARACLGQALVPDRVRNDELDLTTLLFT